MYALSELQRFAVHGLDADVGRLEDVYFDDRRWLVQHLVLESPHWFRGRRVLLAPTAVGAVDDVHRRIEVALTRAQVERCPANDTARPVSRQRHIGLYSYCGFPYDWAGSAMHRDALAGLGGGDPHLRSARAMTGYRVQARNREIGHIDDFLVEGGAWAIRYVVVQTRSHSWSLLVSPESVSGVSWEGRRLEVDMAPELLRRAPSHYASRRLHRA
jgi:hypothetical protein